MATLVLQVAGGAIGGALGGPIGAIAGRALGALAGAAIDSSLLSSAGGRKAGRAPALTDVPGLTATEGAAVPRVYGRARIGGQLIWATRVEAVYTPAPGRSGKGGKGFSGASAASEDGSWSYFANLAIGVCEGPVAFIRRVWADGRELDLATFHMRVHTGAGNQEPDPLIVAKEGEENAPAYRGLAYVVFERLPLEPFSNRIPQFSFEVVRPLNGLASRIKAVNLIPGATEFGYDPLWRVQALAPGVSAPENRRQTWAPTDVTASLDALQALCPNLRRVAIVVTWFGDDLRCGHCAIAPRVESHIKQTTGEPWVVGGIARTAAPVVSRVDGRPAYGGAPSDAAILRLIQDLHARGVAVTLYPFVMMDIAPDNGRPDPADADAEQPAYPWRGRITCHPAPGVLDSPDGTAEAEDQVSAFFGSAAPGDFLPWYSTVFYLGPAEWRYRRFILHYAHLAKMSGKVSAFVLGSELVGLTRVRDGNGYPAVTQLVALAEDVRAVLGEDCQLTYAADWTEYGAHVRDDGAEVDFPLDELWASPAIDAVGVDFYPPLSDWRDGDSHPDAALAADVYDLDYLTDRVGAGEAYDWFYASDAARATGERTHIEDAAYEKPWVFRAKDLVNWWREPHVRRSGGAETETTAWEPGSKPVWLTEIGAPAIDRGANALNVFPDPKSSASAAPPHSRGTRDDLMQLRALAAVIRRFDPDAGATEAWNPPAEDWAGRMVDPDHIYVWAWDARPFPAFPAMGDAWGDVASWWTGHWITGRIEAVELPLLFQHLLARAGVALDGPPGGGAGANAVLDGYVIDRPMSTREALEPLGDLYGCSVVASAGRMRLSGAGRAVRSLSADDLVPAQDGTLFELTRAEESALPREISLGFTESDGDYRRAAATSRRLVGETSRQGGADLGVVLHRGEARRLADQWLQRLWRGRERLALRVSPRMLALEPGDVFTFDAGEGARPWRITRMFDGEYRSIEAESCDPRLGDGALVPFDPPSAPVPGQSGPPLVIPLDLPVAMGEPETLLRLAVFADPWPRAMTIWRSPDGAQFQPLQTVSAAAQVGVTTTPLSPGPLWRFDRGEGFEARVWGGALASVGDQALFDGANVFALIDEAGDIEIIAAGRVELIAQTAEGRLWRFTRLLRGLAGSEPMARRELAAGARLVALDTALAPLTHDRNDLGRPLRYRIGPAGVDHGDPRFVEIEATAGVAALRPLPPAHVRAWRTEAGVQIGFMRRSRLNADGWDAAEPPLGETIERYEVDVFSSGDVARTLSGASSPLLYPADQELADFGAPQTTLDLAVMQVSDVAGRSFVNRRLISIS